MLKSGCGQKVYAGELTRNNSKQNTSKCPTAWSPDRGRKLGRPVSGWPGTGGFVEIWACVEPRRMGKARQGKQT